MAVYRTYPSYPGREPEPEPAPPSVRWAVWLMYAGAVVYLVSGIVGLIAAINLTPTILDGIQVSSASPVPGEVRHALSVAIIVFAVLSLVVPLVLWLWMAWKCRSGRPWARILSTVLFAIATWGTLSTVSTATGSSGDWARLGAIVGWLIGLAVIVLLWQRSATFYFRALGRY